MKKAICVFLSVLMLINILIIPAFATSGTSSTTQISAQKIAERFLGDNLASNQLINTVERDLNLLKTAHLDTLVDINNIKPDGSVTYKISYKDIGITELIDVTTDRNGNVVLTISGDGLQNELVYAKDGSIILDGQEVESPITPPQIQNSYDSILRAGVISRVYAIALPDGADSVPEDKYVPATSYNTVGRDVSLGQRIGNILVSTLISLVASKLCGAAAITIGDVTSAALASVITEGLNTVPSQVKKAKEENPNSDKMSYKVYGYKMIGNDSLYAEFIFLYHIYFNATCDGSYATFGAKKVREAT